MCGGSMCASSFQCSLPYTAAEGRSLMENCTQFLLAVLWSSWPMVILGYNLSCEKRKQGSRSCSSWPLSKGCSQPSEARRSGGGFRCSSPGLEGIFSDAFPYWMISLFLTWGLGVWRDESWALTLDFVDMWSNFGKPNEPCGCDLYLVRERWHLDVWFIH